MVQRVRGADRLLEFIVTEALEARVVHALERERARGAAHRPQVLPPTLACRAWEARNVVFTRRPVAAALGSATLSVVSPAVEITVAVLEAK